ncbi:MAG TPA: TIGR04013 family B12-binding domain/radical SAM domain-containing protein [Methanotrichaceae archaeon]|nr:TIGR04013 family B12-binding domain/radical SAM domain-containing protein [Methanotrichaceae archaeon]
MARDIWFRWNKKNLYSIAALMPLLKGARLTDRPKPGIMLYSFATAQAEEVYAEVGQARSDAVCIAGGPHPSARPEEALEFFDYVVIGEGEEALPELISALNQNGDPGCVSGIAFRKDGQVIYTPRGDQVDLDRYLPFQRPLLAPVEISRGCPWGCAYCQTPRLFGTRMRHRSVPLITKYAHEHKDIRFTSPNSLAYGSDGRTPRLDKVEMLLRSLSELNKPIYFGTFPSEVRPEFVSDRAMDLITTYCTNDSLNIGGQSGSLRVLKSIGRGHGLEEIEAACDICLDHAVAPHVDLIFGLPGESPEDQCQTLDLAKWIVGRGGKVRAHYFDPLPGTPFEDRMPVPLEEDVDKELGRLALEGKLTGKWSPKG